MTDDLDLTAALGRIFANRERCAREGRELLRRSRIPATPDGFSATASGADRSIVPEAPVRPHVEHERSEQGGWRWRCSCGQTGAQNWRYSIVALESGYEHLREEHGARAIDYSDPTGDAALAGTPPDPVRRWASDFLRHVRAADAAIARAAGVLDLARKDANGENLPGADDRWCENCLRDGGYVQPRSPKYAGLCTWCGEFKAANGVAPPLAILRPRHEGRTITEAMVVAALGRSKPRGHRRR